MHYKAIVVVPTDDKADAEAWVDKLLTPYNEDLHYYDEDAGELYDPDGWWDYWKIGWGHDDPAMMSVREAAEVSCHTIVAPDGAYRHREHYNGDTYVETPDFMEFRARTLLAHRDCFAVVVDYHR